MTSVVQPKCYEATRIVFVCKENYNYSTVSSLLCQSSPCFHKSTMTHVCGAADAGAVFLTYNPDMLRLFKKQRNAYACIVLLSGKSIEDQQRREEIAK